MISETSFAKSFGSFWSNVIPWTTPYIHSINRSAETRILDPIKDETDPKYRSIVNVLAFEVFKNKVKRRNVPLELTLSESEPLLKKYPNANLDTFSISSGVIDAVEKLSTRLAEEYGNNALELEPEFQGCGSIANCKSDIHVQQTLVEVKSGDRLFTPSDLRQLLIYCALNWSSGNTRIINWIELYNPRVGLKWGGNLDICVSYISTLSKEELFQEICDYAFEEGILLGDQ
jgi:hypothetical protein